MNTQSIKPLPSRRFPSFVIRHSSSAPALAPALAAALLLAAPLARAQTIPNPSFEANSYFAGVGYASQNGGSITGWVVTNLAHFNRLV